jgi:hypothetical protein
MLIPIIKHPHLKENLAPLKKAGPRVPLCWSIAKLDSTKPLSGVNLSSPYVSLKNAVPAFQ